MFLDLVKQARSHRGFRQDRKVTRQELEHLVECARFTPAARNDQVLKYYLAEKPETVAAFARQLMPDWGGVGIYAKKGFTHIDVREKRYDWTG